MPLSTACPKPPKGSSRLERRQRRADDERELREAYAEVDHRDGSVCWVTGVKLGASPDARYRREHHHLKGRRVRPEWVTVPKRIITVSAEAHDLITGGFIEVEGDDATKPIFFHWNEELLRLHKRKKPFALKSRRTVAGAA